MTLTEYERGTTWKSTVTYQSGSSYVDCSGNMAYLTVYKADGSVLLGPASGVHESTGIYHYFVSTQSTDPLGIYVTEWMGRFNYQGRFLHSPKYDRDAVLIRYVK